MTEEVSLFELLDPVMKQVATQERINEFLKELWGLYREGLLPDELEMQDMLEKHQIIVVSPDADEENGVSLADDVKELIGL